MARRVSRALPGWHPVEASDAPRDPRSALPVVVAFFLWPALRFAAELPLAFVRLVRHGHVSGVV